MWSIRGAVGLVFVAVILAAVSGCSSGGAEESTSTSSLTDRDPSATSTSATVGETGGAGPSGTTGVAGESGASSTVVTAWTAGPNLDPQAWLSDVIVKISRDEDGGDADGACDRTTISDDGR